MKKLLIIDDDLDLLEAMSLFLQRKNYHVVAISDANEWESAVEDFMPDVIVLDILLHGHDGRKISQQIKNDKRFRHIAIVLISALPPDKVNYQRWLADAFVSKPFETDHLEKTLRRLTGD